METTLISIVVGISTGIASSFLFLQILKGLTPKIEISPEIARYQMEGYGTVYAIKLINTGMRDAIDIRCEFQVVCPTPVHGGIVNTTSRIPLHPGEVFIVHKFDPSDKEAKYSKRCVVMGNIEEKWDENSFLRFTVVATDAFSNFRKVFRREYQLKRKSIKDGQHDFGPSLDVS